MVVLVAHVHAKSEFLSQYLVECNSMLAPSRAEEPCITYDFFAKPEDPNHIVFVEEWTTAKGLEDHFAMPHFKRFVEVTGPFVEEVKIRTYEVSSFNDL